MKPIGYICVSEIKAVNDLSGVVLHRWATEYYDVPIYDGRDVDSVVAELVEALEVFANEAKYIDDDVPDGKDLHGYTFQAGDFRKARTALARYRGEA